MAFSEIKEIIRHPVKSIIEQHVEEAAFCWLRREDSLWRPNINLNQFYRIEQRLDAHLEGLRINADYAWPYALKRMTQWKTADEVFAASYIAIQTSKEEQLDAITKIVQLNKDAHNGLSAALHWTLLLGDKEKAIAAIQFLWSQSDHIKSALIHTALKIPEINAERLLTTAINSLDLSLRIKALEAIGLYQLRDYLPALINGLKDNEPLCQLAAGASLAILGNPEHQQDTIKLFPLLERNERLKNLLIWSASSSEQDFETGLPTFNTQSTLSDYIWANAFRGTKSSITRLAMLLDHEIAAPLAAYAIHHITGVELDSFDEPEEILSDPVEELERNHSPHIKQLMREIEGISRVSSTAMKQWLIDQHENFPTGKNLLSGTDTNVNLPPLSTFNAMPQHWHSALLTTLRDESQELANFPKPFFID